MRRKYNKPEIPKRIAMLHAIRTMEYHMNYVRTSLFYDYFLAGALPGIYLRFRRKDVTNGFRWISSPEGEDFWSGFYEGSSHLHIKARLSVCRMRTRGWRYYNQLRSEWIRLQNARLLSLKQRKYET